MIRLNLCTPLAYAEAPELTPACLPPESGDAAGELLFCFALDREQASRIDPEPEHFLGELVFAGKNGGTEKHSAPQLLLPAGLYLFAQQRRMLDRKECIAMAIEQQKDGLWERLKPENRLYIRYLYEDGSPVTQIIRPYL